MSKLLNTKTAIAIILRAKELIEKRGWWRGIDGEIRQLVDVDGKPASYLTSPKKVSGYTVMGALSVAGLEQVKDDDQDKVNLASELGNLFVEAAIAKNCDNIHYTITGFNRLPDTNEKKVVAVLKTALAAMQEQLQ